jgi:inhibitor of KinA
MRVPVCYEQEFGPDLADVAEAHGLDAAGVVGLHTRPTYRVFMLGFLPGFPYMGIVDEAIATARLDAPRSRVPAGSVGVAGRQTGIYPMESPGGWRIIGRTPLRPFDPAAADPFLFAAGDLVEFYAIDRDEYNRLVAA